jgi:hypothetical protein
VPEDRLEALMAVSATPLPDIEVVVTAFAVKFPDASRATIVLAPLAEAAVVRALATVPVVTFEPLIADNPEPSAVIIPALNSPEAPRATIVEAPFAEAAVVLAFAIVPLEMFEALMLVSPPPAPETVVNVPTFAVNEPLASLATMVEAPLAEAAVVRALSMVPVVIAEALIAVIDAPLPEKEAPVIAPALNSPDVPRRTIVLAPLAVAADVRALAMVPDEILLALIFVRLAPLPEMVVAVTTLALKLALASRKTKVFAEAASVPVVLALAMVPLAMFEALIAVRATPLPDTDVNEPVVAVTTLPAKEPFASRATIVEAPLAEAAEVLALSKVPVVIAEALIAVMDAPLPEKEAPVIAPAANSPDAPRRTIVLAPLLEEAVVLAFAIVPEVMLDALMSVSAAPLPAMFAVMVLAEKLPPASR